MTLKSRKVFLDTSVIFAAVLSSSGGARKVFNLAAAGLLQLTVGPSVLRECDEVVRRKAPLSLPMLAQLLAEARVQTSPKPTARQLARAKAIVVYEPDAYVMAEAFSAEPDWFITHDKEHFLKNLVSEALPFTIGTPGDLIQSLKNDLLFT